MSARAIVSYCLIVYALSWSLQFAAIHALGNLGSEANLGSQAALFWLAPGMFIPGAVALLFAWKVSSARSALLWKPTFRMWPMLIVAVVVPTLFGFGTIAICEIAGWGKSGWFAFAHDGVTVNGGPWLLGRGVQLWPKFIANVLVTGLAFSAISALAAIGEELGWRGFLQGPLIARFGMTRGIILLGSIWSFWHLPLLLAGYNYPEYPVLGAFVFFPVLLVSFSFFLGWLTIRSGTFWPAAMAHGAFNSIDVGVTGNLHMAAPMAYEYLAQVGISVPFGLLFWMLLPKLALSGDRHGHVFASGHRPGDG